MEPGPAGYGDGDGSEEGDGTGENQDAKAYGDGKYGDGDQRDSEEESEHAGSGEQNDELNVPPPAPPAQNAGPRLAISTSNPECLPKQVHLLKRYSGKAEKEERCRELCSSSRRTWCKTSRTTDAGCELFDCDPDSWKVQVEEEEGEVPDQASPGVSPQPLRPKARFARCNAKQCTTIRKGYPGTGNRVCCPKGQETYGDGSACQGGGKAKCKMYGNSDSGLEQCNTVTWEGVSRCPFREAKCDAKQCTVIAVGFAGAGNKVCCPAGQVKKGDGSLCAGGGEGDCRIYGHSNSGLPLCASVTKKGSSRCGFQKACKPTRILWSNETFRTTSYPGGITKGDCRQECNEQGKKWCKDFRWRKIGCKLYDFEPWKREKCWPELKAQEGKKGVCVSRRFDHLANNQRSTIRWHPPMKGNFMVQLRTHKGRWGARGGKNKMLMINVKTETQWKMAEGHTDGSKSWEALPRKKANNKMLLKDWFSIDEPISGVMLKTPTFGAKDSWGVMTLCKAKRGKRPQGKARGGKGRKGSKGNPRRGLLGYVAKVLR